MSFAIGQSLRLRTADRGVAVTPASVAKRVRDMIETQGPAAVAEPADVDEAGGRVKIRVRQAPRQMIDVQVRDAHCPKRSCFYPALDTVRSPGAGYSGTFSRTLETWSCGYREVHGCPPESHGPAGKDSSRYRKRGGAWEWEWRQ